MKIKILVIAPPLRTIGGQSIQANRLCALLSEDPGLEITFQPSTFLLRYRYFRTLINCFVYLGALLKQVPGADIIHVFTAGYWSFLLVAVPALIVSKIFRKRTILHYHDGRAFDHLSSWPGSVALCRLADRIVTPTGFLVEVFDRFGLQACPIANTLNQSDYPFRVRDMPGPIFFHNRGLEKEYNVGCSLRAFGVIQKRYPEAQLTVAHDGSLRQELEEMVKTLGLRHVVFTGSVSQSEILKLYDAADIYLSSADADNMPGSVLEAFAAGLPVVATRAGGTDWLVHHNQNGLLADCGDYEALAALSFRLLEEQGLAERLTRKARQDSGIYSWTNVGWKWKELYKQVAAPSANCIREQMEVSG